MCQRERVCRARRARGQAGTGDAPTASNGASVRVPQCLRARLQLSMKPPPVWLGVRLSDECIGRVLFLLRFQKEGSKKGSSEKRYDFIAISRSLWNVVAVMVQKSQNIDEPFCNSRSVFS